MYLAEGEWNPGAYDDALRRVKPRPTLWIIPMWRQHPPNRGGPCSDSMGSQWKPGTAVLSGVVEGTLRPQGSESPGQVPQISHRHPRLQQPVSFRAWARHSRPNAAGQLRDTTHATTAANSAADAYAEAGAAIHPGRHSVSTAAEPFRPYHQLRRHPKMKSRIGAARSRMSATENRR